MRKRRVVANRWRRNSVANYVVMRDGTVEISGYLTSIDKERV